MRIPEIVLGATCFTVLSIFLIRLDAFDELYRITRSYEDLEIDEFILVAISALIGFLAAVIFAVRRQAREVKRALATARAAFEEVALAKEAKNRFLMSMSHEFRTPLNAVMGFSELLRSDQANPLTPMQIQYLRHIKTSGERLLQLVQNLIDLSRIDLDAFEVAVEPVDAGRIIQTCIDDVRADADSVGVRIAFEAPEQAMVVANAVKLRYVLKNLIVNAVSYNRPEGRMTISVTPVGDGQVAIAVSDTGVGIADAMIPRLFQMFDRLGHEGSATAGAGIGLTLSKRLVEAMAGTIEATSQLGVGSTFVVRLPAADTIEPRPEIGTT